MTAQIHENLIIDGERTSMAFCPPIPMGHSSIRGPRPEEAAEDSHDPWLASTACWRGYQGTWEIKDGRFHLVSLRGRYRLRQEDPLPADWFTGELRVPRGEILHYIHMGFATVHEEELHIKIERGEVVNTRIVDNRGKLHDEWEIGLENLPGTENRFSGDDEL